MSLQEVKKEIYKLSVKERLELVDAIVRSLQEELFPPPGRKDAVKRLMGLAKTEGPPPTDAEVEAMLEERFVEKSLQ